MRQNRGDGRRYIRFVVISKFENDVAVATINTVLATAFYLSRAGGFDDAIMVMAN
jgi:hypothetical protein